MEVVCSFKRSLTLKGLHPVIPPSSPKKKCPHIFRLNSYQEPGQRTKKTVMIMMMMMLYAAAVTITIMLVQVNRFECFQHISFHSNQDFNELTTLIKKWK